MTDVLDLPIRVLFAPDQSVAGAPVAAVFAARPDAERLLREAVFALAARELATLVRALPLERAAAALRDRDPVAAVGGLLADAALEHTAAVGDDPLAVALLHGAQRKRELLSRAGGAWSVGAVAEHLGITRQGVDKRRQAGTLLGVRLPNGDWVYPVAQFGPHGAPLQGFAEALDAFGALASPWVRLEHLLAPDSALSARAVLASRSDEHAAAADDAPRSAIVALRDDGAVALPAVIAALQQTGGLDE